MIYIISWIFQVSLCLHLHSAGTRPRIIQERQRSWVLFWYCAWKKYPARSSWLSSWYLWNLSARIAKSSLRITMAPTDHNQFDAPNIDLDLDLVALWSQWELLIQKLWKWIKLIIWQANNVPNHIHGIGSSSIGMPALLLSLIASPHWIQLFC